MIRSFMRVTFPKVIDILFIISVFFVVMGAFFSLASGSLLVCLSVLFAGAVSVVLGFGVIYVLLDIRDALQGKKPE